MKLFYHLIVLVCFLISSVSSLQCWTGTIIQYDNGERSQFIIEIECNAGYCSNMTVPLKNRVDTELHCGSELLEGCDVSCLSKVLEVN